VLIRQTSARLTGDLTVFNATHTSGDKHTALLRQSETVAVKYAPKHHKLTQKPLQQTYRQLADCIQSGRDYSHPTVTAS